MLQLAAYPNTVRYPNSAGQSQPELANRQLQNNAQFFRDSTYQLISEQSDFAPFSNTGFSDGRGGQYNSIENIHNSIHGLAGNGGHLSFVPYSAFDPLFWLHHTYVRSLQPFPPPHLYLTVNIQKRRPPHRNLASHLPRFLHNFSS